MVLDHVTGYFLLQDLKQIQNKVERQQSRGLQHHHHHAWWPLTLSVHPPFFTFTQLIREHFHQRESRITQTDLASDRKASEAPRTRTRDLLLMIQTISSNCFDCLFFYVCNSLLEQRQTLSWKMLSPSSALPQCPELRCFHIFRSFLHTESATSWPFLFDHWPEAIEQTQEATWTASRTTSSQKLTLKVDQGTSF